MEFLEYMIERKYKKKERNAFPKEEQTVYAQSFVFTFLCYERLESRPTQFVKIIQTEIKGFDSSSQIFLSIV